MANSRISVAVHRLTRLFVGAPNTRLTLEQIGDYTGLDADEARIVLDALKDAGLLDERADGVVVTRAAAG